MKTAELKTEDFKLKIDFDERRFVTIAIAASAYGGTVGFYFSAEEMREFARGFAEMYRTLEEGRLELREYYGAESVLSFELGSRGHFTVSGTFRTAKSTLEFTERAEQSYFSSFAKQLSLF